MKMSKWMTRIGRTLMMGLAWAAAWVPVGMVVGTLIVGELEPEHIGGPLYAGFLCGAIFSVVAGIASGRRRLSELSASRAAGWGALSGLLVGALPFVLGGSQSSEPPLWIQLAVVIGSLTALSAASAVASAWLARNATRGALRGATASR